MLDAIKGSTTFVYGTASADFSRHKVRLIYGFRLPPISWCGIYMEIKAHVFLVTTRPRF